MAFGLLSKTLTVSYENIEANDFSKEQIEKMQEHFSSFMKHLGHGLGFKAPIEIEGGGNSSKVTFTDK